MTLLGNNTGCGDLCRSQVQILLGTGVDSDFLTSQLPNHKKDGAKPLKIY
jgi:hypothetical protein